MFRFGLSCCLALALAGCSSTLLETRVQVPDLPITDEDEAALGLQIDRELKQRNVRLVQDEQVLQYTDDLFGRLIGQDPRDTNARYHLHVIDDPNRIDTFSTAGGHIYMHSGLLRAAADEAEVVAAIGHELGHSNAKHELRYMVQTYGAGTMTRLARNDPAALADIASRYVEQGGRATHNAEEENAADSYAMKLAAGAGYTPRAIETFFEGLEARQKDCAWLQRHPVTGARNANVNLVIAREHLQGQARNPERLSPIKRRLEPGIPVSSASSADARFELMRFFGISEVEDALPDIERTLY